MTRLKKLRPQKPRFKSGDRVRVLDARLVKRVGYPKCADDYLEEVQSKYKEKLDALLDPLPDQYSTAWKHLDTARKRIERELCFLLLRLNGFGGSERSIHFYEDPAVPVGAVCFVEGVRRAVTGFRNGGYVSYDGDCEGPYLGSQVHHTLLEIYTVNGDGVWRIGVADGKPIEILSTHVELVGETQQ